MSETTIGFIGAGNMTYCLINGLVNNGFSAKNLWASNPSPEKLHLIEQQFGINTTADNIKVAETTSILILSVKPQVMKEVAKPLASIIQTNKPLVISVAAGITLNHLSQWLGSDNLPLIRCMPNIPAFVGNGATGMYANKHISTLQYELAEKIMRAVGITLWVEKEETLDTIAALSGSGPAYFFFIMEALENAANDLGLSKEDARLFTLQTALGAAHLALSTNESIFELRQRVTSHGGITERALSTLKNYKVQEAFTKAVEAARNRSIEISKQYS